MGVNYNWRADKGEFYGEINGKGIQRKYFPLGPKEKDAIKWKKAKEEELKAKKLKLASPQNSVSFQNYATGVLKQQGQCKSITMKNYRSAAKCHVYPKLWFSQKSIGLIERGDIVVLLHELPEKMSLSQKKMVLNVISKTLTHAMENKIIDATPCTRLGKKIPKTAKDRLKALKKKSRLEGNNVLTDEREQQLLDALEAGIDDPQKFAIYFLEAKAGLRTNEGCALNIGACHWDAGEDGEGELEITQNISDHELDSTKSDKLRYVPMTPDVKDVLRFFVGTRTNPDELIFKNRNRTYFNADQLRRDDFKPIADSMGWGRITPHILRHTYTARLLKAGYDIRDVSAWLGHHSVAFTIEHYGHLRPGDTRRSVKMLDGKKPRLLKLVAKTG